MTEVEKTENLSISEELQVYELGYHLLPILVEENLDQEVLKIKAVIEKNGGLFIGEEGIPKSIKLAYGMNKIIGNQKKIFDTAYFGWIKFEANSESIEQMKKEVEKLDNILRSLLIKSVRESKMIMARKPGFAAKTFTKDVKVAEAAKGPISEEQVDQAIEELVVE